MKAKDYLLQISKIDRIIENKLYEVERWKEIATGTSISTEGEKVQSSGNKQKMAEAVCRYIQIENEVTADIDNLVNLKQDIISLIEQLSTDEYDVLHKIYIQGMTFKEVAISKDKSYSAITTIHGRALASLQRLMNEREQNESCKDGM